jgi:hypothetical protein
VTEEINSWPKDIFDAFSIRAPDCKLHIRGTEGEQIKLEHEFDGKRAHDLRFEAAGRWLKVYLRHNHHSHHEELTLRLPESKDWALDIFSGRGEIEVRDLRGSLRAILGKGNIRIENMQGTLSVGSGQADIRIRRFCQAKTPDYPPRSPENQPLDDAKQKSALDWLHWGEDEWEAWGENLGEKISRWAVDMGRWFGDWGGSKVIRKDSGINVQTAAGNLEMQDIEAKAGIFRMARGNLDMKDINIENLEINLARGNIEGKAVIPSGSWMIKSARGNVQLSVPSNISVRLDMATRRGNVNSEIPLVRVTRQGPESDSGSRMVGTIGKATEGKTPEMYISAVRGNIDIKSSPETTGSNAVITPSEDNKASAPAQSENSNQQLEILKALQEGRISIEEADQMLMSLEH